APTLHERISCSRREHSRQSFALSYRIATRHSVFKGRIRLASACDRYLATCKTLLRTIQATSAGSPIQGRQQSRLLSPQHCSRSLPRSAPIGVTSARSLIAFFGNASKSSIDGWRWTLELALSCGLSHSH